ncbi:hypothetical protein HHK36_017440 [Tetracentron sinense]|uniref:Uncharacterized protein n=1 Tax=Tetracentron sinense TaxID=13715 RepID=A0A834Z773_TETSI|nr:hypothetical protein HHK36_017440 [Tetracentron sinense]
MASISSSLPTRFFQGFQLSNIRAEIPAIAVFKLRPKIPPTRFSFRFKNAVSLQVRQRLPSLYASNTNPSDEDSLKEKTEGSETSDAQGPPILTILAGFVVFFLVCWIVGSIVMWLVGLIFNVLASK